MSDAKQSTWDYEGRVVQRLADQDTVIAHLTTLLGEVADWVCDMGYPIDFTTENLPPAAFRILIEDAWVRRHDTTDTDDIRACIAEEWQR